MQSVNIFEAKTNLSKLLEAIEQGREPEVVIARHGRPVAKLIPIGVRAADNIIGVAKGQFVVPESIDNDNEAIQRLFTEEAK